MNAHELRQADGLLRDLLELPDAERADALRERCGDNPVLRELVERLLRLAQADDDLQLSPGGALGLAGVETQDFAPSPGSVAQTGDQVGAFRLTRLLGRGGMASVFLAERTDGQLQQQVALKILDRLGDTLVRFEQERQILASLDHPNIARFLDAGITDRHQPYVVMEHVDGIAIDRYCDEHRLTVDQRLDLLRQVIDGVRHAHERLVVHRDIKPSNILVTADGVPKLLDFGIAKLLQSEGLPHAAPTTVHARPMTPQFASPEQVRGESITTASDNYQLGYLAYWLLTGRTPYPSTGNDYLALTQAICETAPRRPSRAVLEGDAEDDAIRIAHRRRVTPANLSRQLRGDPELIVTKALRKAPEQRYRSADEMALDIGRFLDKLPISARPESVPYRLGRFVQRHRLGTAAAVAAVVTIVGLTSVYTWRLSTAVDQAQLQASKSRQVVDFVIRLFEVSDPLEAQGETVTARALLDESVERLDQELASQPELLVELKSIMGRTYQSLGLHDAAEPLLDEAVALAERALPEGHPQLGVSLTYQGNLALEQVELERAETLLRRALTILEPTDLPEKATALETLALALQVDARYAEAEEAARRAVALRRAVFGDVHRDTISALSVLSIVLTNAGRGEEAGQLLYRLLDLQRALYGTDDHVDIAMTLNNLGTYESDFGGSYAKALPHNMAALETGKRVYGEQHPTVAIYAHNTGVALASLGRLEEARLKEEESLRIARASLGDAHPVVPHALHSLGAIVHALGDRERAEQLLRESLELRKASWGPDHPQVALTEGSLARILREQGKLEDAEALLRHGLAATEKALPADHIFVLKMSAGVALVLMEQGRLEEAEQYARRTINTSSSLPDSSRRRAADAWEVMGRIRTVQGHYTEARTYLEQAMDMRRNGVGIHRVADAARTEHALQALRAVAATAESTSD